MSQPRWPVKILLVHPQAPFLSGKRVTVAADCAALVSEEIPHRFRSGEAVIIGCPLLEDPDRLMEKLALVVEELNTPELDVFTMEVPCCHAIHFMVDKAVEKSGKSLKVNHYIVRVFTGKVEPFKPGRVDESMIEAERMAHGH